MKYSDNIEGYLAVFFEQMKAEERMESPSFSATFEQAERKQWRRQLFRYLGLGILLLVIIIGAWQYEERFNSSEKEIPIIRASVDYYNNLMEDGKIVTNDIHFAYNEADVKPESLAILQSIAQMMETHPKIRLRIEGHTDNTGAVYYNLMLSEARAKAVKQVLIELDIDQNRLLYEGFGEARPVQSNETEIGRTLNRRVEFVLLE